MSTATGVLVPLMLATEAGFAKHKWLQTRAQAASAKAKLKRLLRAERVRFGELGTHPPIEPVFSGGTTSRTSARRPTPVRSNRWWLRICAGAFVAHQSPEQAAVQPHRAHKNCSTTGWVAFAKLRAATARQRSREVKRTVNDGGRSTRAREAPSGKNRRARGVERKGLERHGARVRHVHE